MKCATCGSGKNSKQRLGFMERYTCHECGASWTDQIEAVPGRNVTNPVTNETYYQPGDNGR